MGPVQKTAIVVPCFNEGQRLQPEAFLEFAGRNPETDFLFADDGSTDSTTDILRRMRDAAPERVDFFRLEKNSGKARAVREGFNRVVSRNYGFVGFWDADLSTPLGEIPRMRALLKDPKTKAVLGSRVRMLGRAVDRRPGRHYAGRVIATLVGIVLDLPVYDSQCGAKLFRNDRELQKVFQEPFRVNWTFDVEILARYMALGRHEGNSEIGGSLVEYPLTRWCDVPESKVRAVDFFIVLIELTRIFLFYRSPGAEKRTIKLFHG